MVQPRNKLNPTDRARRDAALLLHYGWRCPTCRVHTADSWEQIILETLEALQDGRTDDAIASLQRRPFERSRIIPGGAYTVDNYRLECDTCNQVRGRTIAYDLMDNAVIPDAPTAVWQALLKQRRTIRAHAEQQRYGRLHND